MAAKKSSNLGPKVRKLLEKALLEALKRHYGKSDSSRAKKKTPARKKKTGKKKVAKKRPVRRRKRRA
ncbi:MAG TPA: hypothetical protein VGM16_11205 [Gammaproteobacteria bacterium]|jgi:hypothetical protein